MPLHTIPENILSRDCKEYIQSLELWLRRIIDEILTKHYGKDYFNYQDEKGNFLISKKIQEKITNKIINYALH